MEEVEEANFKSSSISGLSGSELATLVAKKVVESNSSKKWKVKKKRKNNNMCINFLKVTIEAKTNFNIGKYLVWRSINVLLMK